MLYAKFIQNWNGSELTNTGTPETPVYATSTLKNTSTFTDGLKIAKIDFDAESYLADDFFLRSPREAKIILQRDTADWLRDNFLYHNDNEINHVLYMEEDGTLIEYVGSDPGWTIGQTINTQTIHYKETLIQQYSKIIIEIWETTDDARSIKRFTGLINKSETNFTHTRVTLNCIDFTGLIKIFGEQLIKVFDYSQNENYIEYVVSNEIVNELLNKIISFTKLNLEYINDISNYGSDDDIITQSVVLFGVGSLSVTLTEIQGMPVEGMDDMPLAEYMGENSVNIQMGASSNKYFYVWKSFWVENENNGYVYNVYVYRKWRKTNDVWVLGDKQVLIYPDSTATGIVGLTLPFTSATASIDFAEKLNLTGKAYLDDGIVAFWERIDFQTFTIRVATQSRYSLVVPIYVDTYKYMVLLKMVLFLNIITIYANADGNINILNKNLTEQEAGSSQTINERDVITGYSLSAVEKDELEMSDALESIWYDVTTEGRYYDNLDNKMKEEYAYLFLTRFPIEFNGSIKYESVILPAKNIIGVGNKLYYYGRYWIVVSAKLDKTRFSTKVKAYGLATED